MKVSRSELGSSCGAVVPAAAISLSWGDCRHKQLSAEVDGLRHCPEQLVRRRKIRFLLDNGQQNCTRWEVEAKTPNQDIFLIKKCLGQSLWFCHTVVSEYLLELSLDETKSVQDQSVGLTEPHVRHPPTSMIGPFAEMVRLWTELLACFMWTWGVRVLLWLLLRMSSAFTGVFWLGVNLAALRATERAGQAVKRNLCKIFTE